MAVLLLSGIVGSATAQAAPEFQAASYPATVHGSSEAGTLVLGTEGGTVECKNTFDSVMAATSSTIELAPTFTSCSNAFGFIESTVNAEGCKFPLHATEVIAKDEYRAHLDLDCPSGKSIKITAATCSVELKAQTGLTTVRLIDDTSASPVEDITFDPEVKSLSYTVTKDGLFCPFGGTGSKVDGTLSSNPGITLTGQSPSESGKKIGVRVTDKEAEHAEATTLREDVEHAEHTLDTAFPEAPEFTASQYPATIHGSSTTGTLTFSTEAGLLECSNSYHGEISAASSTLDLTASYASCNAFGFIEATVNAEGCGFRLHGTEGIAKDEYRAHLGVKCPVGKSIKIVAATCSAEIKEQTGLTTVKVVDDTAASPVEDVTFTPEAKSLSYTVTRDALFCPFAGIGNKTDGQLAGTSPITLTGQDPSNASKKIGVRLGDPAEATHFEHTAHEAHTAETAHLEHTTETTPKLSAGSYPATVHGSSALGSLALNTEGGAIECQNGFHGELKEVTTTLAFALTFTGCQAFGFLEATVNPEGCKFVLHATEAVAKDEYKAHMSLECAAGKSIKVVAATCAAEFKPQTNLTTVRIVDDTAASPVEDITFDPEVTGIAYTVTKDGFLCPFGGTGNKTGGQLTGASGITLTGQSPSEPSKKIGIRVST